MCIKEKILEEVKTLFHVQYVPVMINCPCPKCNNVDLSGPIVSLEDA